MSRTRNRNAPPPPPPEEEEEEIPEEEEEDRPFDDVALRDGEGMPLDPEQAGEWVASRLGGHGFGNPHPSTTKIRTQLAQTPIAACAIEGAYQYMVEKVDPASGDAHIVGNMPLGTTTREFISRFVDAMPERGQEPAEFFFTAVNKAGVKLGEPGKPYAGTVIPWNNVDLLRMRDEQQKVLGNPQSMLLQMLQQQVRDERAQTQAAIARMEQSTERERQAREKAAEERIQHAQTIGVDLSSMYQRAGSVQAEILKGAAQSSEDRARIEREERKADAEERVKLARAEADARVAAIRAEADAKATAAKAELDMRVAQMKIEADVRMKEMELRAAELKAKVESDRLTYEKDRDREEANRKEERNREDARRKDEREADQKRLDAEATRQREYNLSMEKMRMESIESDKRRQDAENIRQKEHMTTLVALLERQNKSDGGRFGVVGDVLDALGMTPMEALARGKELMGGMGGGGLAETVAKGVFDILKVVAERVSVPAGDEMVEEREEEEEDVPPEPRRERPAPRITEQVGPSLESYLKPRELAPVSSDTSKSETPKVETPQVEEKVTVEARREGRAAAAELVERLSSTTINGWSGAIAGSPSIGAFIQYVTLVGLDEALNGHDIDVTAVEIALNQLGLFPGPVPRSK